MKTIIMILSILVLSSCVSTPKTPSSVRGLSTVDKALQNDTYEMFKQMASTEMRCKTIEYAQVIESTVSNEKTIETWVANGCGKSIPFSVSFIPSVAGGYTYQITSAR